MGKTNISSHNKFLFIVLQTIIIVITSYYIYQKIEKFKEIDASSFNSISVFTILSLIFLSFINWLVEVKKWQIINNSQITFKEAFASVVVGVFLGQLTPNRIGEPIARSFVFNQNKKNIIANAYISSLLQSIPTLIFGVAAILFFSYKLNIIEFRYLAFVCTFTIAITILLRHKIQLVVQKIFHKYNIETFKDKKTILWALLLSFGRYFVFLLQNCLIFSQIDSTLEIEIIIFSSAAVYFVVSYIPNFILTDIGIRGSVAIFFYNFFTTNIKGTIFATFVLWYINLSIPMFLGLIKFINLKNTYFTIFKRAKLWIYKK